MQEAIHLSYYASSEVLTVAGVQPIQIYTMLKQGPLLYRLYFGKLVQHNFDEPNWLRRKISGCDRSL